MEMEIKEYIRKYAGEASGAVADLEHVAKVYGITRTLVDNRLVRDNDKENQQILSKENNG